MKRTIALLLAGLLLLGLASCGLPIAQGEEKAAETDAPEESAAQGPAITITLGIEAKETDEARLEAALEKLRRTLPDIAVERVQPSPGAALPDLLLLDDESAAAYAASGLLADLSEEPLAAALLEQMTPADRTRAVDAGGACYALPARGAETWCLFIDDGAFRAAGTEPPRSREELTAALAAAARTGRTLVLCPEEDEAALAFFEGFLTVRDERGLNALFRGESGPYDESLRLAADELYRLSRAGAVSLMTAEEAAACWQAGEAAAIFVRERQASAAVAALGEDAHLLPLPGVVLREGESLAVSAASEHRALAVETGCLLCKCLAEFDRQTGCGACLTLPGETAGSAPLTRELTAYRSETEAFTRLEPERAPALAEALAEGVRELLRGTMTPDEFAEAAGLALDAQP